MTHIEENREEVEAEIERLSDRRNSIIATTRDDMVGSGEVYLYPRRSPNARGAYIRFIDDIEANADEAVAALNEISAYRFSVGDSPREVKYGRGEKARVALRIAENDAKAIHAVLMDNLPVQTYALLRELFATLGGRTEVPDTRSWIEKLMEENGR